MKLSKNKTHVQEIQSKSIFIISHTGLLCKCRRGAAQGLKMYDTQLYKTVVNELNRKAGQNQAHDFFDDIHTRCAD